MSKKMVSVRLSDDTRELISSFPSSEPEPDFTWQLEELVRNMTSMLNYTARELTGLITEKEANLICDSLNGMSYMANISPKSCLLSNINDSVILNKLDKKWEIDATELMRKLEDLTEFQAYTIMTFAFKFWNDVSGADGFKNVKEYFPGL